jgi:hypothetical protein
VDPETPARLSVKAMGAAWVQGTAEMWGRSGHGVEHVKIRPRSMTPMPESSSGNSLAGQLFRWFESAEAAY